ncbi:MULTISPECIES: filamentous hemagglutinin N-terminal domain-containing protein [unclassified Caballeronia]|uniref:two-partner secretion domain-containing protein n=1 Tax=unclassified Caballeronia TaxID=2646786 RepID=UPI0028673ED7|nr:MULTISPECIES: filamentous hemagglutinin N-terminal domain-containing protein [unclassified Caballeronia]MDR5741113.1 filamentous hemagglutinin N-terminal domain-containing protein [Caballeronia sp. LZ016]MDR5807013.1 filamentous hemagglutinin N-terminal domain-containing protein [Caballeronia sp. LZ019]
MHGFRALLSAVATVGWSCVAIAAGPLPQNGRFVAGSGSIASSGTRLDVIQSTPRGVIDWNSFSIGRDNSVAVQNGTGATLSRVTGTSASIIDGSLTATGSLYLVNPQGVLIGSHGIVTTGGRFVASTLDVGNDDFMKSAHLTLNGASNASVVNLGKISSSGGDVFLISVSHTENAGSIDALNGTAELVSARQVLLKDSASDAQVFVQAGAPGNVINHGAVRAAQIRLEAADGNVYALAGNQSSLRATGTATRTGRVWLVAKSGDVQQHQPVEAANSGGDGGVVETVGRTMQLDDTTVHADKWLIGLDELKAGPRNSGALSRSLSDGTSVVVNAAGDIDMLSTLRWSGNATLALNAGRTIEIGPVATISNTGAGKLTLRADAQGIDNHGSVINAGTIDWTRSTGAVAALVDENGRFVPGTVRANCAWIPPPFSGLRTQVTAYRLVNSVGQLERITQDLSGNYALGKDIASDREFTPIGTGSAEGFTGQFDGFGHGLSLSFPKGADGREDLLGLFASIGRAGVARNFSMTGSFGYLGSATAGLVAGQSAGLIANVSTSVQWNSDMIGLSLPATVVGYNTGTLARVTTDATMYAQGLMTSLAGANDGRIVQSSANIAFSGGTHAHVGGLVSYNGKNGVIEQSYVTGTGSGVTDGGIALSNAGVIRESFAAASLPNSLPPGYVGAVASSNSGNIASDVYWDKEVSTLDNGVASGTMMPRANGLTTAQMSRASSFAPTWDFAPGGTWTFVPGVSHPVLQWQVRD